MLGHGSIGIKTRVIGNRFIMTLREYCVLLCNFCLGMYSSFGFNLACSMTSFCNTANSAYNPGRARTQNITVGVSFGARRELAFLRATPQGNGEKVKIYFPQTNNGVFSFGRDVNILLKHGINALAEEEQNGKGRISIILWGLALSAKEEERSPPMLGSDGQGPHAKKGFHGNSRHNHGNRKGNNKNNSGQRNGQQGGKKQQNN